MLTPCVPLLADQNSAILVFVHFMDTPEQCSLRRDDLRIFVHAILSGSFLCTLVDPSYDRAFAWMWYHPYQGKSLLAPCPILLLSQHVMLLGIIRFYPLSSGFFH